MTRKKKRTPEMIAVQRYARDVRAARAFLNSTAITLPFLARETGISYWWLARFARGDIADPKVSKLGALLRFVEAHDE